jgi:hypothetical protein
MDAHHFDVARFIRPVLSSIALSLSIIVISSMTMVKLALASGTIPATILLPGYTSSQACQLIAACLLVKIVKPKFVVLILQLRG